MRRLLACLIAVLAPYITALPPAHAASLAVHLTLSPDPPRRGHDAVLLALTAPGAGCRARVRYGDGHTLGLPAQKALSQGLAVWVWRPLTEGSSGTAVVACTLGGADATATEGFRVIR